jgi:4Fe-4S single cluster domain
VQNSSADLQNQGGDKIIAEAEFNMMENINLLITEHCNLACAHCSTGAPFAKKISHSAELFCKWLDLLEAKEIPFKYISLTGGEPFLHPEVRDGSFIRLLRIRYPSKRVGLTTNFFWASEERIIKYAPIVGMMNGGLAISVYEPVVKKLGGLDEFHRLAKLLKDACPNTWITTDDRSQFLPWEFHEDEREVKGPCVTSDCFVLKPDGKLAHCSLAIGAQNIPEYNSILKRSKEALLDLSKVDGKEEFLSWSQKYPFDLCLNCTMWEGKSEPWHSVR